MALTDMKIFNKFLIEATIETVSQDIAKFNEASRGAIILSAEGFEGDFLMASMFQSLEGAQRRVDRKITNSAVTATPLAQIENASVKVAGGFGPILWEPSQLTWMQMNEVEAITALSKTLSEAIIKDQLNTGILAATAAIGNNSALVEDGSAGAVDQIGLNNSHALFGDRSSSLIAEIMDGITYHKLIGEALTNGNRLFSAGDVTVIDILGKPVIVTDAPALRDTSGTPKLGKVLSLSQQSIVVTNASDLLSNIQTVNGKNRIETTFQADYTFGLGVKGYAWKTTAGGSPTDDKIGTGTNWQKYVSSNKDTAGTMLIFDSEQ